MDKSRKKYIIVLIITVGIFVAVFSLVDFLDAKKRQNISQLQNRITVDLIANETQFDLLKNVPCKAINEAILSRQLGELGEKLAYAEKTQGVDNQAVVDLKKYYSLLQVKDYLLSQEVSKKCDTQIESIIYFYEQNCDDCTKQGYVLSELKKKYPWLRIYSFDRNLDFSIIKTFAGLYNISEPAPIIIINGKKYSGFKTVEEIEKYIPELILKSKKDAIKEKALDFITHNEAFKSYQNIEFDHFIGDDNKIIFNAEYFDKTKTFSKKEIILNIDSDNNFTVIRETS